MSTTGVPVGESRLGSELGRYDQAPSIAHRYRISPIHGCIVPLVFSVWDRTFGLARCRGAVGARIHRLRRS